MIPTSSHRAYPIRDYYYIFFLYSFPSPRCYLKENIIFFSLYFSTKARNLHCRPTAFWMHKQYFLRTGGCITRTRVYTCTYKSCRLIVNKVFARVQNSFLNYKNRVPQNCVILPIYISIKYQVSSDYNDTKYQSISVRVIIILQSRVVSPCLDNVFVGRHLILLCDIALL